MLSYGGQRRLTELSITTKTDFLGRTLEVTDVWGIKTSTVFDVAGRVISSSSPGGTVTSTYDDANRLLTQSIDGVNITRVIGNTHPTSSSSE